MRTTKFLVASFFSVIFFGMNMSFCMQNSVKNGAQKRAHSRGFLSWLCALCCVVPEEHEKQEREKQEIKSKEAKAEIKEQLDRANGPTSATAALIEKDLKNKKQIFISAVDQGNTGLVRECLEEDALVYMPAYAARAIEEDVTEFTVIARDLLEHRKKHNLLAQKDTNLDRLAGIALIRADCNATRLFLQAGADIRALESAQFTWKQIEKVADWLRFGVSGHTDTIYTPLHYFLQYKEHGIGEWNQRSYDTMVQELVAAGVNFHAPTSTGRETILEAGKHDRAVIKRAEKARDKQVKQAARASEQDGQAPEQDALQQNRRMRERSASAIIPEDNSCEESPAARLKSTQDRVLEMIKSQPERLKKEIPIRA